MNSITCNNYSSLSINNNDQEDIIAVVELPLADIWNKKRLVYLYDGYYIKSNLKLFGSILMSLKHTTDEFIALGFHYINIEDKFYYEFNI